MLLTAHSSPCLRNRADIDVYSFSVLWPSPESVPDTDCIRLLAACKWCFIYLFILFFCRNPEAVKKTVYVSPKPWACLFWKHLASCQSSAHVHSERTNTERATSGFSNKCTNCHSTPQRRTTKHHTVADLNMYLCVASEIKICLSA